MATLEELVEEARQEAQAAWEAYRAKPDRLAWADYEEASARAYALEAELRAMNEELDAANEEAWAAVALASQPHEWGGK